MRRLLLGQLRHRRGRLAALGLAILVAAASFTLLTASATTSSLHVRQTLKRNFRGAYDILVRPRGSFTPLEREEGLVRDNYLSGIHGGITLGQYHRIEHIPGIAVAAPIANIGYVLLYGTVQIRLGDLLDRAPFQLFRVRIGWLANGGISRYPMTDLYVYFTRRDRFVLWPPGNAGPTEVVHGWSHPIPSCSGYDESIPPVSGPFDPNNDTNLFCYSAHMSRRMRTYWLGEPATGVEASFPVTFPVLLSAIDPIQEAKLVHLDRTVTFGRYLRASDRPHLTKNGPVVPVISSSRTYVREALAARIERLRVPPGVSVPDSLVAGACHIAEVPCPKNLLYTPPRGSHRNAFEFLRHLRGRTLARRTFPVGPLYEKALPADGKSLVWSSSYWIDSGVRYGVVGPDHLEPIARPRSQGVWYDPFNGDTGYFLAPTDNEDVQFRTLREIEGSNLIVNGRGVFPTLKLIGRFDPARLPGFSPLSKVPLETYYPPDLEPANAAARTALHGKPFGPTQNLGAYVTQPPLLLTTLRALPTLLGRQAFPTLPTRFRRAPISAIRVRVAGVTGPNPLSETRIRTVAQLIHARTGLAVDITAGSSPHPMLISLPKGRFGRPPLLLREGWTKKGASVSYLRALDRKDLALFALILVVCAFFLGNGAFASVRARRAELGALATLGWSPAETFRIVLAELAVVGLAAGIAGTGLAAALVSGLGLDFPLLRTLFVLPIAVTLALVAGLVPAWLAARGRPLDAVRPPVAGGGRGRRVRSVAAMAFADLARLPVRSLVGASGLALGVAALTVMVAIERGFQGVLVSTVLGNAVSVQVRSADFVALGLTVTLAALSAADVLYLNVRERQAELVTLATLGWSDRETRRLLGLEALYLALAAGLAGALVGVLVGALVLGVGAAALAVAAIIAAGGAAGTALFASLLPLARLHGLAAPEVLAAE